MVLDQIVNIEIVSAGFSQKQLVPETQYEQEIVWLIGNFISYAWNNSYVKTGWLKLTSFLNF